MPTRRILVAIAALACASLAILPTAALAADGPDVSGTVTFDGAPFAGASVQVLVEGSDMVWTATTDANGAWAVTAGVAVGQTLTVSATSPIAQSSPDERGCVTYTAHSGRAQVAVQAVPVASVAVALDSPITSIVCGATATPHPQSSTLAQPTPPATDASRPSRTGGGIGAVLLVAGLAAVAMLAVGPAARRVGRRP